MLFLSPKPNIKLRLKPRWNPKLKTKGLFHLNSLSWTRNNNLVWTKTVSHVKIKSRSNILCRTWSIDRVQNRDRIPNQEHIPIKCLGSNPKYKPCPNLDQVPNQEPSISPDRVRIFEPKMKTAFEPRPSPEPRTRLEPSKKNGWVRTKSQTKIISQMNA